jgi:hypothetical protein
MSVKICYVFIVASHPKPTAYYALEDDVKNQIINNDRSSADIYVSMYASPLPGDIKRGIIDSHKLFVDNRQVDMKNNNVKKITIEAIFDHARGIINHGKVFEAVLVPVPQSTPPRVYKLDAERDYYGSKACAASFLNCMTPPKDFKFSLVSVDTYRDIDIPKLTGSIVAAHRNNIAANSAITPSPPVVDSNNETVSPINTSPLVIPQIPLAVQQKTAPYLRGPPSPPTITITPSRSRSPDEPLAMATMCLGDRLSPF